jgi:hypothetical protein
MSSIKAYSRQRYPEIRFYVGFLQRVTSPGVLRKSSGMGNLVRVRSTECTN